MRGPAAPITHGADDRGCTLARPRLPKCLIPLRGIHRVSSLPHDGKPGAVRPPRFPWSGRSRLHVGSASPPQVPDPPCGGSIVSRPCHTMDNAGPSGPYYPWSGRRGSNSLPPPWQGGALPDELRPHTGAFSAPLYYMRLPPFCQSLFSIAKGPLRPRRSLFIFLIESAALRPASPGPPAGCPAGRCGS